MSLSIQGFESEYTFESCFHRSW